VEIVPAGARIPFQLDLEAAGTLADYKLQVVAFPASQTPRQDFDILDIVPRSEGERYCLSGNLKNSGSPLRRYLVLVTAFYDDADRLLGYQRQSVPQPEQLQGETLFEFDACTGRLNKPVASYKIYTVGE
jgi:hypothetical protein